MIKMTPKKRVTKSPVNVTEFMFKNNGLTLTSWIGVVYCNFLPWLLISLSWTKRLRPSCSIKALSYWRSKMSSNLMFSSFWRSALSTNNELTFYLLRRSDLTTFFNSLTKLLIFSLVRVIALIFWMVLDN